MTVSYTPIDIGHEFPVGVTWLDMTATSMSLGAMPGPIGGIQYIIPAPNELMFRSLILTLAPMVVGGTGVGTVEINLCRDLDLQPFSNANLPSNQDTISIYSAEHTFVVDTSVGFDLRLGANPLQTGSFVGGMDTAAQWLGHSDFQGVIGLTLTFDGDLVVFHCYLAPANPLLVPTFVGDEVPFLSGLPSNKAMSSRADWCPRCGQPLFREQLIEDGYTKGLVCSDCYDPPEPRGRRFTPTKEVNP